MSRKGYFQSILNDDAKTDFSPGALIDADNKFTINPNDFLIINQNIANEVDLPTNELELKKYLYIKDGTPMLADFNQMYPVYTKIKNNNCEYQQNISPLISSVTIDLWSFTIQIIEMLTYASSLLDDIRAGKSPESSIADLKGMLLTLVIDDTKTGAGGTEYYNNKLKVLLQKLNQFVDATTKESSSIAAIQESLKVVSQYKNIKKEKIEAIDEINEQISTQMQKKDIIKRGNNKTPFINKITNAVQGLIPDKPSAHTNQMKTKLSSKQELYQRDIAVSDLLQRVETQSLILSKQATVVMTELLKVKETWDTIQSSVNTIVALNNSAFLDPLSNVSLKRTLKVAARLWGDIQDSIKIFTKVAHIQPPKQL
ncbi:MAG: hypothetical protein QM671_25305 [Bacillus sp. (in: firmicutes)]|uniref:hypothetical protein n=1 Tax=Bacillus sp. TaxID=1409 RepID=UPI0039E5934D